MWFCLEWVFLSFVQLKSPVCTIEGVVVECKVCVVSNSDRDEGAGAVGCADHWIVVRRIAGHESVEWWVNLWFNVFRAWIEDKYNSSDRATLTIQATRSLSTIIFIITDAWPEWDGWFSKYHRVSNIRSARSLVFKCSKVILKLTRLLVYLIRLKLACLGSRGV